MFKNAVFAFLMLVSAVFLSATFDAPAQAGNCGGATRCSCGDTLTASRTLNSKTDPVVAQVCSGDGLIMITSGVELNLGGNKIQGSGDGVGILIRAGVINVTIKNGGVDVFETGIGTEGFTSGTSIQAIRPNANLGDGIFLQGDFNELTDILAKRNGNNGVTVIGNNNRLEKHNDEYSGFHGIFVDGDGNHLIANEASENANKGPASGMRIEGHNNTLERNKITKLNTTGIVVEGNGNTLDGNRVTKQRSDGFVVNGDNNILSNNSAVANRGVGFFADGSITPQNLAASTGNRASVNRQDPECNIYGQTGPPQCIEE